LEHTLGGTTPFHAFAFPSTTFTALQLRFTEAMAVHEDWELQTRAIQYLGVESVNAVTAIYRRHHGGDTLATHPSAIRDVLFADLVREQLANQVFLVDGEELLNFRDRTKQAEEIWRQKNDVIALLDRTMEVNAELREELRQLRSVGGVLVRARDKVKRKVRGAFRRVGIGRR
jgi:hypothetical protein